jgi:hypothetical protein
VVVLPSDKYLLTDVSNAMAPIVAIHTHPILQRHALALFGFKVAASSDKPSVYFLYFQHNQHSQVELALRKQFQLLSNIGRAPLAGNHHIDAAMSAEGHLYLKNLNQLFGSGKIELSLLFYKFSKNWAKFRF